MNEILLDYERQINAPRHEDNIEKFDRIFAALNQVKGVIVAFGLIYTGFKIFEIVRGH